MDLVTALARARTAEEPGPDTPAGPAVPDWPGPARTVPPAGPGRLDLDRLLRLSLAAADPSGRLRPAPSAGALHPVDARLAVGAGCSLPPGTYGYDPLRHRVHHLGPAPHDVPPGVTVELTVTARRTASHYGHRAWPLLLLDTGHAAAALRLAARALGTAPAVARLDGTTEHPLAAVHIPSPAPGPHPPEPEAPAPAELLARRSAPPPLTGTPARDDLHAVLATAREAGAGRLRWCVAVGGPRPELVEASPDGTLRRLASGEARPTLAAWAAGQGWIAGAGAVLLAYGCPSEAGPPRIRRDHLHAGHAVGCALLTAARRGLAARPVGSWQRADLGAALGGPPAQNWIVHGLALGSGRPEKRTS
ncbi:SagB/ThcOx family dehydrogenase [Streptomyces pharetrae]|uniref:nitroreductase family protein n=1 Tax=Streptomyces pharetrae TaxID=291370 RepID=UPI003666DD63